MVAMLENLYFSQAAISAWLACPLKFKRRYVDGLYWPLTAPGTYLELGRKFHLLAQHYFATGSTRVPSEDSQTLEPLLARLAAFLPRDTGQEFLPEYELRFNQVGLRLLAKYDLLVPTKQGLTIYDWKTDAKPPAATLVHSAQTRLYMFLASSVPSYFKLNPEQLAMVYWNPAFPDQPLRLSYDCQRQEQDRLWLEETITQIKSAQEYPARTKQCSFCEYRPLCQGTAQEADFNQTEAEIQIDWDEIPEIAWQGVNIP